MNNCLDVPFISVLLPARNEERDLPACLHALCEQVYPLECYEIVLADDLSTDGTLRIMESFQQRYPQIVIVRIQAEQKKFPGKTGALDLLTRAAKGELFVFTDADTIFPPNTLAAYAEAYSKEQTTGIWQGYTLPRPTSIFGACQTLEWEESLKLIYFFHRKGKPTTSMGNHMAVRKDTFWLAGGYEAIGFHLTEDFALFQKCLKTGWKSGMLRQSAIIAETKAETWNALFDQRYRWLQGALEVPNFSIYVKILLYLQPLWAVLFIVLPMSIPMYGLLYAIHGYFLRKSAQKKYPNIPWLSVLAYPWYIRILYLSLGWKMLFRKNVVWKDISYKPS